MSWTESPCSTTGLWENTTNNLRSPDEFGLTAPLAGCAGCRSGSVPSSPPLASSGAQARPQRRSLIARWPGAALNRVCRRLGKAGLGVAWSPTVVDRTPIAARWRPGMEHCVPPPPDFALCSAIHGRGPTKHARGGATEWRGRRRVGGDPRWSLDDETSSPWRASAQPVTRPCGLGLGSSPAGAPW